VSLAAVLLAGGASRRMGRPKATLPIGSSNFLTRLIDLYAPHCSPIIVVFGHGADALLQAFAHEPRATFAVNPDPERGQLSSLQTGLALTSTSLLFQPIDYPAISAATVAALAASTAPLAIPVHQGRRGHPVRLSAGIARELLALPPTAQARDVIRAHYAEADFIPVNDPGTVTDIDTPEDYAQWIGAQWIA
jgi:molybdenum cofactor cytidylyltransferase